MDDRPEFDLDINAVGTGCLTGCGSGCLTFVLLIVFVSMAGLTLNQLTADNMPGWLLFIGFLLGLASDFAVGYVTASVARSAPIFHAVIVAVLTMVVSLIGYVLPQQQAALQRGQAGAWGVIAWFLMIPITIWGANVAVSRRENRD